MQTTAQNTKSIRLWSVKWTVDGVDYGLLDAAKMEITYKTLALKASNGELPPRTKPDTVKISCEMYEIHLPNVKTLDTSFDYTPTVGSATPVTGESLLLVGASWATGEKIILANKNWDKTMVSTLVVKNGSTTLVKDTDYYAYTYANGDVVLERKGTALTIVTGGLTADYSYTPYTMHTLTLKDVMKIAEYRENKFVNVDENGKEFRIIMPKGYKSNGWNIEFASDQEVDQAMKPAIEITASANDDNVLLIIEDEQSVE